MHLFKETKSLQTQKTNWQQKFRYMLTLCSHIDLLAADRAVFLSIFMPRTSHYGENAHHIPEIPEGRGPAADKLPGLSKGSSGGRSPAEVKRAMHPDYAKREAKKAKSREQTKAANSNQK